MKGDSPSRTAALEMEGWVKQFVASEPRLSEAVQLYKESGFEVHLEPLPKSRECGSSAEPEAGNQGECRTCFEGFEDHYKIIFTRPSKDHKTLDEGPS